MKVESNKTTETQEIKGQVTYSNGQFHVTFSFSPEGFKEMIEQKVESTPTHSPEIVDLVRFLYGRKDDLAFAICAVVGFTPTLVSRIKKIEDAEFFVLLVQELQVIKEGDATDLLVKAGSLISNGPVITELIIYQLKCGKSAPGYEKLKVYFSKQSRKEMERHISVNRMRNANPELWEEMLALCK